MPKSTKFNDLNGLPIFQTGTWHGHPYTTADLDGMVAAFQDGVVKPPVKLGHTEHQKLLQSDGLPSAGWVANLRREGEHLIADLKDIPKKVFDLIQKKAYDHRSIELYKDFTDANTQKSYPMVLKAMALLGADLPELNSLDAISALYHDTAGRDFHIVLFDAATDDQESNDFMIQKRGMKWVVLDADGEKVLGEHDTEEAAKKQLAAIEAKKAMMAQEAVPMTDEEKKRLEAAERAVTELMAKLTTISTQAEAHKATAEQFSKSLAEERLTRRKENIDATVSDLVRKRKVTPAQKETLIAVFGAMPEGQTITVSFMKDGKAETETLSLEAGLKRFLSMQPELFGEETLHDGKRLDDEHQLILKYCKDNALDPKKAEDYARALVAVIPYTMPASLKES